MPRVRLSHRMSHRRTYSHRRHRRTAPVVPPVYVAPPVYVPERNLTIREARVLLDREFERLEDMYRCHEKSPVNQGACAGLMRDDLYRFAQAHGISPNLVQEYIHEGPLSLSFDAGGGGRRRTRRTRRWPRH